MQGLFPDDLKFAKVIPIHKKDRNDIFTHYRPVSLLSVFSKIYEKCMSTRLLDFLEKQNILYEHQYGFKKDHSTFMAVLKFVESVRLSLEDHKYSIGLMCDLSKAFDSLNHNILMQKLNFYGIRGTASDWFQSYLSNRKQVVQFEGETSNNAQLSCGVPQGTILGPLLFIIYVNDLYKSSDAAEMFLYADDTNILFSNDNLDDLNTTVNKELSVINEWFKCNKLVLNPSKTNYIIFRSPQKHIDYEKVKIYMNDKLLDRTTVGNFLGVLIDETLSWKPHIKHVETKISKTLGVLHRVKFNLDFKTLKTIYYSLIYSYLNYNCIIWGTVPQTYLTRLHQLQKQFIRIIDTNCQPRDHTLPYFKRAKILNVYQIIHMNIAVYVFKCIKGTNKPYKRQFKYYFIPSNEIHDHSTRQQYKPRPIKFTTCFRKFSICKQGPDIWNGLPEELKVINSVSYFKTKLKQYLLTHVPLVKVEGL